MTKSGSAVAAEDRFSLLFMAQAERLVRLAALLGAYDAEDAVQEAFCKVFAARSRIRGSDEELAAYLTRAVVNQVRDRHRRTLVARRSAHLLASSDATVSGLDSSERDAVVQAVAALPDRQREAVVLRYWLDLSLAQVAEAMGTRLGTAKSHVSRGLAAVESTLDASGSEGS
ncbi:MAG TPA: sigma-70 family RNA polymerase sigma factor [Nocardioidaceae bacterium]|nr:sigma-70 family RNA polymerase sigma factor [Nocardioidaceae bacterium]